MTDLTDLNISIMSNRDDMMTDEGRWPGVPPDPQETTLRTSLTNKLLVNEDSHDAATVPRFLGRDPPSDGGGRAFFTELHVSIRNEMLCDCITGMDAFCYSCFLTPTLLYDGWLQ